MESKLTDRLIGIEIECVVPVIGTGGNHEVQSLLASILTNQNIRAVARQYCRTPVPPNCKIAVEYDASLRGEDKYDGIHWSQIETKTMPMTWTELQDVLPQVLEIIKYCGARVNNSCGLHVHHDFSDAAQRPEIVKSLQHLWWRFHPVMYGLVAPSRRGNNFCSGPRQADATRFDNCRSIAQVRGIAQRCSRYDGLNFTNLADPERNTVEFRLHQGSLDWSKIKAWILATQRFCEHAVTRNCHYRPEPMPNTQEGLNALLVTTGLKPNSRIYKVIYKDLRWAGKFLLKRWKQLNLREQFKGDAEAA